MKAPEQTWHSGSGGWLWLPAAHALPDGFTTSLSALPIRRQVTGPLLVCVAEVSRQRADGRIFEQLDNRYLSLKSFLQLTSHPYYEQRMPTQVEEIVMNPDSLQSQQFLPEIGNGALHFRVGRNIRGVGREVRNVRSLKCLAIKLPVGVQR